MTTPLWRCLGVPSWQFVEGCEACRRGQTAASVKAWKRLFVPF